MFFGMHAGGASGFGGPGFRVYRQSFGGRRHHHAQEEHAQERRQPAPFMQFMQLLPLLLLFLTSFFSFSGHQDPIYSFEQTPKYATARYTGMRGVVADIPYFVQRSFESEYAKNSRTLYKIEKAVEGEYESKLRYKCGYEKETKRNLIQR